MNELLEKLIELRDSMVLSDNKDTYVTDPWYYTVVAPFYDFNYEIIEPGAIKQFPNGATGIRVDDDFWTVGVLPYEFRTIPLIEVIGLFWPQHIDTATYNPTTFMIAEEED